MLGQKACPTAADESASENEELEQEICGVIDRSMTSRPDEVT